MDTRRNCDRSPKWPRGGTGRRTGLKIRCSERDVSVRLRPGPPLTRLAGSRQVENTESMPRVFSTYLDALRFLAAMAVVIAHFTFPQFTAGVRHQGELAGLAVTVFFVLSGYVIAYVADKKEH